MHGDGHLHAGGRIFLDAPCLRIAEEGQNGVADVLVDGSAVSAADRAFFVSFAQLDHNLDAVLFLADDLALLFEVVIDSSDPVVANRLRKTLDGDGALLLRQHAVLDQGIGLVGNSNSALIRAGFKPGREAYLVAYNGVVHAVFATEITDGTITCVISDPQLKRLESSLDEGGI